MNVKVIGYLPKIKSRYISWLPNTDVAVLTHFFRFFSLLWVNKNPFLLLTFIYEDFDTDDNDDDDDDDDTNDDDVGN